MTNIGNRGKQVPPPVTRLGRPDVRLADPERSLTYTLTSTWGVLVAAMGEEKAQEFRDYLRAHNLDILPITYGLRAVVSDLHLTDGGRPMANIVLLVDRLGKIEIDRVRIHKDKALGLWGLDMPTAMWQQVSDGERRWEPRYKVTGVFARHIVHAMLNACVEAEMLPATELGRVRRARDGRPSDEAPQASPRHALGLEYATGTVPNVSDYSIRSRPVTESEVTRDSD